MGSFTDEYLKLRKKREEEDEEEKSSVPYQRQLNNDNNSWAVQRNPLISSLSSNDDIAPVKEEEKERTWFQKSGLFDDGYQFGDVSKAILGSLEDVGENFGAGFIGLGEKAVDAFAMLGQVQTNQMLGESMQSEMAFAALTGKDANEVVDRYTALQDETKKATTDFVKKDLYNEEEVAKKIVTAPINQLLGIDAERDSVFGEKSDALAQSAGQLGGTVALQAVGVPWWLTTGVSTFGSEAEGALNSGATMEEAALSSLISAGAEILTEKISGGISFGGNTLDDALTKELARGISNKTVRTLAKIGVDMVGEGSEEILSGVLGAIGQKLTYAKDKELDELFSSEEAFESFIGGAVLGGGSSVVGAVKGKVNGVDPVTEMTKDEQAVFDKVYNDRIAEAEKDGKLTNREKSKIYDEVMNDFEKGYISTDTIEEVLGGEDYTNYQNEVKRQQDIDNELNELRNMKSGDMTDIQMERMAELKAMTPNTELVETLKFGIDEKIRNSIQGTRLAESYNENARRGQAFEADLSEYDSKQAEVIKKAIESGILNNTNRTHDFVDMVAKISADKGVLFDFANNAKLKESGFGVNGKFVNGYVTKDGITVNIDSNKALNSIVGHEITHVLEGTELYAALKVSIQEYAKSKGEYDSRLNELTKLYEGVEGADISAELTADLVGDYLFTDSDFINHLSTTNRNVFQRIFDEIKYLYKIATAGSKQARELEKVKRAFDKAYRESGKTEGTKYSLSDSDGKKLTKEQSEYFKDSKMRDDNGNLKVMYHGSQDAGFHIFDPARSDDDTSLFFVDRNDVAASYSGTSETYEAQSVRTAEDVNNFIKSIGYEDYEVIEENGKFTLIYDGDRVADSDSAAGIYEEFCWYEGVGEGDANYKVYLNLVNPLVVDAEGRNWNNISREFSQEIADRYHSLTAEEKAALTDLAEWGEYGIFKDEMLAAAKGGSVLASANEDIDVLAKVYEKLGGANANLYDAFSIASENFSAESIQEFAVKQMNTRDFARKAKAEGYDGVIFKNIHDNGGYSNGSEGASTVAIAFESNQIKSVANDKPTADRDIRYSLSDSEGTELSKEQQEFFKNSKIRNENGNLKVMHHGSPATFTVFDKSKAKSSGTYGKGFYFTDSTSHAATYGKSYDVYLNITNPLQNGTNDITKEQIRKFVEAIAENEDYGIDNYGYDATIDSVTDSVWGKSDFGMILDLNISCVGNMVEAIELFNEVNGTDYNGIVAPTETVAFYPNQIKSIDNKAPTADKDIRYSLSEYTAEEKKAHNDMVLEHFGKTYKWAETGYLLLDGTRLDLSGKHDGAPGGYRTVDHRDITEALGYDYGGGDYSGSLIQFMSEGNIRIIPELNGINLSVKPTKAQEQALADFISRYRGEMVLDIDDLNGNTVVSVEYPKGTYYTKILNDIRGWFDNGTKPEVASRYPFFSLSDTNEAPTKKYDSYNVYGKDIRLPGAEDIGPVAETITEETVDMGDEFAPVINSYTIEQELAEIDREIESLVEESTELYNKGEEAKAMELVDRINGLSDKAKALMERANTLKAQEEADERAYIDSFTEADMPMEAERAYSEADTTPLDDKTLKILTRNVRNVLAARPKDNKAIREIIERYSTSGQSKSQLFKELRDSFGTIYEYQRSELADIKNDLLTYKFNVSDKIKSDIADWGDFRRDNKRVRTSKDALPVDQLYEELSGKYPGVFSPEIVNETDRFLRINEVANTPSAQWVAIGELSDNEIMEATDFIHNEVNKYKNSTIRKAVEADARAYIDEIAPSRAKQITNAPLDDAPRYQAINSRLEQDKANLTEEFKQKKAQMQSELADENTFISRKAKELYNEIRSLKKGVRASRELGYILDHGYEWKSIKTALINAMNSPGKRVNQNSAAEGVVREMLHELYEDRVYELSDMDNEYQRQSTKLEANAEKERGKVQIKTVKERIAEKLSNVEKELADNKMLRAESIVDFNREIARLQEEYAEKENKNTKVANNILRRIESLHRMKNNVDADYEKRISDLEAKKTKLSEEARTGASATEQAVMRAELHLNKIDGIRAKFAEKGLDFDKTLKNAKDLSTFATVDNTPQRVMEKALGYREGQILADETVNKVAQNETEGIKWLNSYTDRKNGLLAQISKQYNIKPGSKESAAAQMYAEGFYVNKDNEIIKYGDNELAMDFPDSKVQANIKGLARDTRIRQIYDETLDMINSSRARNAYPEIQKLDNYFLHFRAMDDTFSRLGLPFNPNDITAKDLPTDLNGVTADLKPGQPYFASSMHREGLKTSYDLLGGLERYLSSAKNQIYHIDDIQTLRALRNHIADTYGQAKGLKELDSLSEEEAQEKIKQVFDAHLSTFAKFLNEEANVIAGKTALIDRGLEGIIGRRGMTFMNELNKQVGANMVGFNVSSSLTNFVAPVQAFAKTNKAAFVKGFAQTAYNKLRSITGTTDGFAENSPVMIRRKGADRFYRTPFQKVSDAGYVLMSAVDDISTEIIARAKYNELTAKGMSADQAHIETDKWVSRLMGDRSLGQMPQIYNSKMLGLITKFQLEVRNQLDSQFYDTIQETKADYAAIENKLERNSKTAAKVTSTFVQLAIAQHLFGMAFESIAGYNPAFDIIEVLIKTLGFDDDEESEDTVFDNIQQGFMALLEDLPYTSTFTGGRIPISSALPIKEFITGKDQYGNEINRLQLLGETAPYYFMPGGYGQVKKTIQGLSMFSDEHPIAGSYTDSGSLRFPVDETFGNVAQAAIFGQWASENARDYFDNDIAPLNEKQTQEFIDVGMTIQDYWKYREGLSQYKTLAEKADYIYGLDLTDEQKNILINNIADREEDIDMSDYGNYGSFEEFDYANKYPEKYAFWKQNGISYEDYISGDDDTKAAYNWAYENPDKFTLSKAVASDVVTYRGYTKDLYELKADKDEDGKSIVGSRKEKVIDYVNNLDADYGSKIILFKSEYPADDTYNYDIIEYLNSRDDISYSEMETILKELGFNVDKNGNITWD